MKMSPGRAIGAITLGDLIDALARLPDAAEIEFDYWRLRPGTLHSYRGYYEDLTISVRQDGNPCRVIELLKRCREVLHTEIKGYKGGSYFVDRDTGVWASNYSEDSGVIVTGVEYFALDNGAPGWATLTTRKVE